MQKLLIAAAVAVAASAIPASAEAVPTAPCDVPANTTVLGVAGTSKAFSPALVPAAGTDMDNTLNNGGPIPLPKVPNVPYHEQSAVVFNYIVDLSGSATAPSATTGDASLTLAWDNDSDFDMWIYDAAGDQIGAGTALNPIYGTGETATLSGIAHCTVVRVDVVNYAGVPTSAMTLSTSLKNLK